SEKFNSHWFMKSTFFSDYFVNHIEKSKSTGYSKLLETIKPSKDNRKNNKLLREYYKKYHSPELPPSDIIAEITTFGTWSIIFRNLKPEYQKTIVTRLLGSNEFNYEIIISWISSLSALRNICVHYERLWNHDMTYFLPSIPHKYSSMKLKNNTLYIRLFIIQKILNNISPDYKFEKQIQELINQYNPKMPFDIAKKIGFPI
ncbi:MAG: Abi family protein, partial [Candidatus Marithrix sp.]